MTFPGTELAWVWAVRRFGSRGTPGFLDHGHAAAPPRRLCLCLAAMLQLLRVMLDGVPGLHQGLGEAGPPFLDASCQFPGGLDVPAAPRAERR